MEPHAAAAASVSEEGMSVGAHLTNPAMCAFLAASLAHTHNLSHLSVYTRILPRSRLMIM